MERSGSGHRFRWRDDRESEVSVNVDRSDTYSNIQPQFQVPTNLVLLKNVSVVGLHWGAYQSKSPVPTSQPSFLI